MGYAATLQLAAATRTGLPLALDGLGCEGMRMGLGWDTVGWGGAG